MEARHSVNAVVIIIHSEQHDHYGTTAYLTSRGILLTSKLISWSPDTTSPGLMHIVSWFVEGFRAL